MFKKYLIIFSVFFSIFLGYTLLPTSVDAGLNHTLRGYAWSDNIGWISLNNCQQNGNVTSCGAIDYGVSYATTGPAALELTGYGWSDNIGWVAFNRAQMGGVGALGPNGSAAGSRINVAEDRITGWARACAGAVPGDCTTATSRTDGWDGWIHLGDQNTNYGITLTTPQFFNGWAWGSEVVGWVDFIDVSVKRRLTVNKTGFGRGTIVGNIINCDLSCLQIGQFYPNLYAERLVATPGVGARFEGRSGACASATGNTCHLLMNQDRTATADFSYAQLNVIIDNTDSGVGTINSNETGQENGVPLVCSGNCTEYFYWDSNVTLVAVPSAGWRTGSWTASSDCMAGGGRESFCTVHMDDVKTVHYLFERQIGEFADLNVITNTGSGNGTVTNTSGTTGADINCKTGSSAPTNVCSKVYTTGAVVTLRAQADAGHTFQQWTGGDAGFCNSAASCRVTMDTGKTVVAEFSNAGGPPITTVSALTQIRICSSAILDAQKTCPSVAGWQDAPTTAPVDVPFGSLYQARFIGNGPPFTRYTALGGLGGVFRECTATSCTGLTKLLLSASNVGTTAKDFRLDVYNPSAVPETATDTSRANETAAGALTAFCYVPNGNPPYDDSESNPVYRARNQAVVWTGEASGGAGNGSYDFEWNGTDIGIVNNNNVAGGEVALSVNSGNGYETVGLKQMTVRVRRGNGAWIGPIDCWNDVRVSERPIYEEF